MTKRAANITVGTMVSFTHKIHGILTGTVTKMFANGKAQIACSPRYSAANGKGGIRKTTYNVEFDRLTVSA